MLKYEQRIKKFKSEFQEEVLQRMSRIDPYKSEDWYSIALGWAIAKGIPPEVAHEFSKEVRYYTEPLD